MKFFTVFCDDWIAGTADLDAELTGAYWNICVHYMSKDGHVPDEPRSLARISRVSSVRRWKAVRDILIDGGFIEVRDGFLVQRKCDERLFKDGKSADNQRQKSKIRWTKKRTKALVRQKTVDAPACAAGYAVGDPSPNPQDTYPSGKRESAPLFPDIPEPDAGKPKTPKPGAFSDDALAALAILREIGVPDPKARPIVGRWRKDHSDEAILRACRACTAEHQRNGVMEPVGWITRALARPAAPAKPLADADRLALLDLGVSLHRLPDSAAAMVRSFQSQAERGRALSPAQLETMRDMRKQHAALVEDCVSGFLHRKHWRLSRNQYNRDHPQFRELLKAVAARDHDAIERFLDLIEQPTAEVVPLPSPASSRSQAA